MCTTPSNFHHLFNSPSLNGIFAPSAQLLQLLSQRSKVNLLAQHGGLSSVSFGMLISETGYGFHLILLFLLVFYFIDFYDFLLSFSLSPSYLTICFFLSYINGFYFGDLLTLRSLLLLSPSTFLISTLCPWPRTPQ